MNDLQCTNCAYCWKEDGDRYACCHYPTDDPWPAPCEYEEYDEEDDPAIWAED